MEEFKDSLRPMFVKLGESLLLGIISAGFMLFVGHQVLLKEVESLKEFTKINRAEMLEVVRRLEDRFSKVEDCIRVRSCTK